MRKVYLLGFALLAVFAFAASAASSAFAEPALWLVNGAEFLGETLGIEIEGLIELINLRLATKVDCEGILVGTIKENGEGLIESILTLGGVAVTLTAPLVCTTTEGTCGEPLVAAENLPWLTTLELMTTPAELFLVLLSNDGFGLPAYAIDCLVIGILVEETCEGETSAWLELMTGNDLLGIFEPAELVAEELEGVCSGSGAELVANVGGSGLIRRTLPSTEEVDVSSN